MERCGQSSLHKASEEIVDVLKPGASTPATYSQNRFLWLGPTIALLVSWLSHSLSGLEVPAAITLGIAIWTALWWIFEAVTSRLTHPSGLLANVWSSFSPDRGREIWASTRAATPRWVSSLQSDGKKWGT